MRGKHEDALASGGRRELALRGRSDCGISCPVGAEQRARDESDERNDQGGDRSSRRYYPLPSITASRTPNAAADTTPSDDPVAP